MYRKQFGQADVYDSTKVIMNIYRIPGSSSRGKDNRREGKVSRWEGRQRESNLPDGGDQTGGDDYRHRESFESRDDDKYQDIWGDRPMDVRYTGESVGPPCALDWEELGNYGTDSEVGGIWKIAMELAIMRIYNLTDIAAFKVPHKDNVTRESQVAE